MKSRNRIAVMVAAAVLVTVGSLGTISAIEWIGSPFPGFLVLENRVVASASLPEWGTNGHSEIFQKTLVAVDGARVWHPDDLRAHLEATPPEGALDYRFLGDAHEFERAFPVRIFSLRDFALLFGSYLLNGALLGGVGLLLLARGGRNATVQGAVPFLLVGSLWGFTAMDLYGPYRLFRLHALCESFLFATALQMAFAFPRPVLDPDLTRRVVGTVYAAALLLAVFYQLVLFEPVGYVGAHLAATSIGGAALLAFLLSLYGRYLACTTCEWRRILATLLVGAGAALVLPVWLTLPEAFTGGRMAQNQVGWTVFLLPLVVAYVLWRWDPGARRAHAR